jgi:Uma2 family endonuclease
MQWKQICGDPILQNLPFKIETNEWGQIVMSPATNKHGYLQGAITLLFYKLLPSGKVITECSIQTSKGVKVADVVWFSEKFSAKHGYKTPYSVAPEICVGIVSPSNSKKEMQEKMQLYFERGAKEVWFCNEKGRVKFFDKNGSITRSKLAPDFPSRIKE